MHPQQYIETDERSRPADGSTAKSTGSTQRSTGGSTHRSTGISTDRSASQSSSQDRSTARSVSPHRIWSYTTTKLSSGVVSS